jgi:branched-chain amino acid transport system substrate-binding protein
MRSRTRTKAFAIVAATSLVIAACGGDDDADGPTGEATADEPTAEPTAEEPTAEPTAEEPTAEEPTAEEPTAEEPTAEEPTAEPTADEPTAEEPSGDPVKIGALTSLTATFAPWGIQYQDGARLAIEEINAAGGAGGRPLELVVADDQSNAEEGVSQLERLIEDGVVAVGGIISSDVGLATSQLAEEAQVPLFLVKSGAAAILTPESRYTFRTCLPAAPMVSGPILQYAESEGLTKVGAIIADYGWGRSIEEALNNEFEGSGIELQIEVAPVPEQDFTTYLRALEEFGPELIVATGHPPGSGAITVQSADLGFDVPVTGAYTPRALVVGGAADAAIDRYSDFGCADYASDDYQDLARRYLEMSDNSFMEDDAVAGYGHVMMVAEAVEAVGDDPVAIAEYLHANTFDLPGYSFEMSWTEWGELAAAQPIFTSTGAGPAPEGVNEAGDWYPETLLLPEPLTPYEP